VSKILNPRNANIKDGLSSNFEVGVVTAGQAAAASAGAHEQPNLTHHFTGQPVARHGPFVLCCALLTES
jgi:hypothetical protein